MNKIILISRPNYDDGTEYLSQYASLVLKRAEEAGIQAKDFLDGDATCFNICKFIEKQNPNLIFLNGHGDEKSIEGHKETLFSVDKNIKLLKDRIVYARACHAAVLLGKEAVQGNNGCFIGYTSPFSFWIDGDFSAIPLKDKTAALFLEPSNEIINSLISGDSTEAANEKSKKQMIRNMNKILSMEKKREPGAMGLLQIMWNNFEGQVLLGNQDAKF
jgi:hypothetical protein